MSNKLFSNDKKQPLLLRFELESIFLTYIEKILTKFSRIFGSSRVRIKPTAPNKAAFGTVTCIALNMVFTDLNRLTFSNLCCFSTCWTRELLIELIRNLTKHHITFHCY